MAKRSLSAQIEELTREIAMRERVYPYQVAQRKMKQGEADEHMLRLECALETLRLIERHESEVRALVQRLENGERVND